MWIVTLCNKILKNPDSFTCYVADPVGYEEARKEIERTGMGLLNEDEWEYCCGSGTRSSV